MSGTNEDSAEQTVDEDLCIFDTSPAPVCPEGKNVSDWIFFLWRFEDDILKSLATSFGI
jgi:hypothetical protein